MQPVSPRFARMVLIPISTLIFFVGLLLASIFYFSSSYSSSQQRTFIDALISWLQSPDANPRGYLFATAGTAVGGILLAPVALMFYRRLSTIHRTLAAIGSFFLAAGLLAAVLIGCLAPFPQTYEPLHIPLAYAAFIAISTGLAVCLAVAALPTEQSRRRANPFLMALAAFMGAVVLFLFYMLLVSDSLFDNQHWYSSLAFLEWLLCAGNAAYTYLLAAILERNS
jgi:hypothetical protein